MIQLENEGDIYLREIYEFTFVLIENSLLGYHILNVEANEWLLNIKRKFSFDLFFIKKYDYVLGKKFLFLICEFIEKKLNENIDDTQLEMYMKEKLEVFRLEFSKKEGVFFEFKFYISYNGKYSITCDEK